MLVGRIALQINFFSNPIFTNPQTSQVLNFPFQLFYEESKMRRKKSRICIILYCTNICLEKCYLKHSTFVFALQHLFEMRIYLVHLNYTNSQSYYVRANGRFFYTFFFCKILCAHVIRSIDSRPHTKGLSATWQFDIWRLFKHFKLEQSWM